MKYFSIAIIIARRRRGGEKEKTENMHACIAVLYKYRKIPSRGGVRGISKTERDSEGGRDRIEIDRIEKSRDWLEHIQLG